MKMYFYVYLQNDHYPNGNFKAFAAALFLSLSLCAHEQQNVYRFSVEIMRIVTYFLLCFMVVVQYNFSFLYWNWAEPHSEQ